MRAYELHGVNDLRREDIEKPEIPSGWVLVQVKASGICSSDIPRIFTNGTYHFPTIPGHEFSGVVAAYAVVPFANRLDKPTTKHNANTAHNSVRKMLFLLIFTT